MELRDRRRRTMMKIFWRFVNPFVKPLAGRAPWWVILETIGRRSQQARQIPLATGPHDEGGMWLLAVHGNHADFVANLRRNPKIRLKFRGRWRNGTGTVHPLDPEVLARFNRYARSALLIGIEPRLIRIDFTP